ncbi:CDP-glycerol glycerophosphotransferase family protein [Vagococcus fluvialis]|uniref:CDP-glycerol glycerophosphotransferase family protein n=1 Tax=Vagococcus fluvialis TaxID=2738 RepID=UPI003B5942F8
MKKILVYSLNKENFINFVTYYNSSSYLKGKYILNSYIPNKNRFKDLFFKFKYLFYSRNDVVISDYPTKLLDSSKKFSIAMGHGTALKRFPADFEIKNRKNFKLIATMKRCKFFIVTSERQKNLELRAPSLDRISNNIYLSLGLPKNDNLFKDKDTKKNLFKEKKIILYVPTYRDYGIAQSDIFDKKFFEELIKILKTNNSIFIYKFHPSGKIFDPNILTKEQKKYIIDGNTLDFSEDELLLYSDLLISDYSSLAIKYLILDRPILYFWFDYDRFVEIRGMDYNLEADNEIPADISKNKVSFFLQIKNFFDGKYDNKEWKEIRKKCMNNYYEFQDEFSSRRIWNLIDEEIGDQDEN